MLTPYMIMYKHEHTMDVGLFNLTLILFCQMLTYMIMYKHDHTMNGFNSRFIMLCEHYLL